MIHLAESGFVLFWQQRLPDCVVAYPFFFLRRKKNLKKKELQGGCPLDPRCGERHHHRMGYQRDGSVQAAQRGQIKARTVKRSAANILLGFPLRGSQSKGRAARLANKHFFAPNTETFSALHPTSVTYLSRLARSPGGLGGRSRIEFIVSPLPRRRHNESHFAAQSPERSFFF